MVGNKMSFWHPQFLHKKLLGMFTTVCTNNNTRPCLSGSKGSASFKKNVVSYFAISTIREPAPPEAPVTKTVSPGFTFACLNTDWVHLVMLVSEL
jgi:hypothetical protein